MQQTSSSVINWLTSVLVAAEGMFCGFNYSISPCTETLVFMHSLLIMVYVVDDHAEGYIKHASIRSE